jgi:hypothetical protein
MRPLLSRPDVHALGTFHSCSSVMMTKSRKHQVAAAAVAAAAAASSLGNPHTPKATPWPLLLAIFCESCKPRNLHVWTRNFVVDISLAKTGAGCTALVHRIWKFAFCDVAIFLILLGGTPSGGSVSHLLHRRGSEIRG